ncbi:hypothetical protein [Gordonia sp. VNK21]|uniref:hypothetical protein n=1 Tax=Gordonia sp. VNK21 TaxID=3382483 RepID=UPI0038D3DC54
MRTIPTILTVSAVLAMSLTACSGDSETDSAASGSPASSVTPTEQRSASPRLAAAYDGGVQIYDATDLSSVADLPLEGFVRLNPAGDDRYVFASTADGFELIDMGSWSEAHGDHSHHYTVQPRLTGIDYAAEKPGHVVVHDGRTTLFDDGTGTVRVLDTGKLGTPDAVIDEFTVPAHHGVAVARADGSVVISVGDEDSRSGLQIRGADGKTLAENDSCPGLHGEGAAAGGALTFGCEDGALLVRGEQITKITAPDPYARLGNQAGDEDSPVVLTDYKTDKDAELERPRRFALIDTVAGTITPHPIDATYSFRSLGRGRGGEAVLLGSDGALHVFDTAGRRTAHYPVIDAWTEPDDWQEAMPVLEVIDDVAYVSDPATEKLYAVGLDDGKTLAQAGTPGELFELTGA